MSELKTSVLNDDPMSYRWVKSVYRYLVPVMYIMYTHTNTLTSKHAALLHSSCAGEKTQTQLSN